MSGNPSPTLHAGCCYIKHVGVDFRSAQIFRQHFAQAARARRNVNMMSCVWWISNFPVALRSVQKHSKCLSSAAYGCVLVCIRCCLVYLRAMMGFGNFSDIVRLVNHLFRWWKEVISLSVEFFHCLHNVCRRCIGDGRGTSRETVMALVAIKALNISLQYFEINRWYLKIITSLSIYEWKI